MAEAPLTVLDLLRRAEGWFREQGISSPRLDAEVLLAHVLGCRRLDLYLRFDQVVEPALVARFRELCRERGRGRPVAYLVGAREFFSRSFAVDPRVLIPRPETEILVEEAIRRLPARDAEALVVDIGTGSGAIALSVAAEAPRCRLIAVDLSSDALDVARRNAEALGQAIASRVELLHGDLFEPLEKRGLEGAIDLVISNPPYISDAEVRELPRDVRDYEPEIALRAGPRGTEIHERLFATAPRYLRGGGSILLEVAAGQADAVKRIAGSISAFGEIVSLRDFQGIERVIAARRA